MHVVIHRSHDSWGCTEWHTGNSRYFDDLAKRTSRILFDQTGRRGTQIKPFLPFYGERQGNKVKSCFPCLPNLFGNSVGKSLLKRVRSGHEANAADL